MFYIVVYLYNLKSHGPPGTTGKNLVRNPGGDFLDLTEAKKPRHFCRGSLSMPKPTSNLDYFFFFRGNTCSCGIPHSSTRKS